MSVAALDPTTGTQAAVARAVSPPAASSDDAGFERALSGELGGAADDAKTQRREEFRRAAGDLVAAAFILPLLNEMRNSSMNSDLMGGGMAQDSMQQMLDVELAGRIATSPRFPIVNEMVERYLPDDVIPFKEFSERMGLGSGTAAVGGGVDTHG